MFYFPQYLRMVGWFTYILNKGGPTWFNHQPVYNYMTLPFLGSMMTHRGYTPGWYSWCCYSWGLWGSACLRFFARLSASGRHAPAPPPQEEVAPGPSLSTLVWWYHGKNSSHRVAAWGNLQDIMATINSFQGFPGFLCQQTGSRTYEAIETQNDGYDFDEEMGSLAEAITVCVSESPQDGAAPSSLSGRFVCSSCDQWLRPPVWCHGMLVNQHKQLFKALSAQDPTIPQQLW